MRMRRKRRTMSRRRIKKRRRRKRRTMSRRRINMRMRKGGGHEQETDRE